MIAMVVSGRVPAFAVGRHDGCGRLAAAPADERLAWPLALAVIVGLSATLWAGLFWLAAAMF